MSWEKEKERGKISAAAATTTQVAISGRGSPEEIPNCFTFKLGQVALHSPHVGLDSRGLVISNK